MAPAVEALIDHYRDINALDAAMSMFGWDRQVLMPPGGADARSEHQSILARLEHELWTSDKSQRLIEEAQKETEPDSDDAALVRVFKRDVDQLTKLPAELVARKSKIANSAYEVWKKARAESDFAAMKPYYKELIEINRETSRLLDPNAAHPYDPMLDLYEEGATYAATRAMFDTLKSQVVDLVKEIQERGQPVDDSFFYGTWNQEQLRKAGEEITGLIGFDYSRGRLDICPNAFCTNMSNHDVRMTTKPSEHVKGILSSSLHEMGHGLYEQGSPDKWDRTPLAGGVSMAVHESQSRMWENVIGRCMPFWSHFLPVLQKHVPELSSVDLHTYWRGINKVQPGFIRVGADELTYNLHILVRFELEVDMMTNQVQVDDLPEAWNAKYTEYLGITPPNDGQGVLQDVHWSRGYCGYFPTYTMGNLISGMVWSAIQKDLPDALEQIGRGEFGQILEWCQQKIYRQARRYTPQDLVKRVCGKPMAADDWVAYAKEKFGAVYGL
jgi:carboxypeptidase Taq